MHAADAASCIALDGVHVLYVIRATISAASSSAPSTVIDDDGECARRAVVQQQLQAMGFDDGWTQFAVQLHATLDPGMQPH